MFCCCLSTFALFLCRGTSTINLLTYYYDRYRALALEAAWCFSLVLSIKSNIIYMLAVSLEDFTSPQRKKHCSDDNKNIVGPESVKPDPISNSGLNHRQLLNHNLNSNSTHSSIPATKICLMILVKIHFFLRNAEKCFVLQCKRKRERKKILDLSLYLDPHQKLMNGVYSGPRPILWKSVQHVFM